MRRIFTVLLYLTIFSFLIYPQHAVKKEEVDSLNNIWAIAEQGDFLWIGTLGGLVKFDKTTNEVKARYYDSDLGFTEVLSLATDKNGTLWIGCLDGGGVTSYDGSSFHNYTTSNSGLPENSVWSIAVDSNNVKWFGTWGGLAKFDGKNWTQYTTGNSEISGDIIYSITIDKNNVVWAGTDKGLSRYSGTFWTLYNSKNSDYQAGNNLSLATDKDGNIWAGTEYYGIYKLEGTTGNTWTNYSEQNTGIPNFQAVFSILGDSAGNIFAAIGGKIIKYDGTNWKIFGGSDTVYVSNSPYNVLIMDDSNNIWSGSGGLVKFSGNSWERFDLSVPTGVENNKNQIPSSFSLSQNYPNPFNPSTVIKYQIPKESFVTIKVYDVIGREVKTLVNGNKSAGSYELNFNASQLPSGIYFYRVTAEVTLL